MALLGVDVSEESPRADLNGDGDRVDIVLHVAELVRPDVPFRRGGRERRRRARRRGRALHSGVALRRGTGAELPRVSRYRRRGRVNITDAVALLRHLLAGGETPPAPGAAACGSDPTEDGLGCASFGACP